MTVVGMALLIAIGSMNPMTPPQRAALRTRKENAKGLRLRDDAQKRPQEGSGACTPLQRGAELQLANCIPTSLLD